MNFRERWERVFKKSSRRHDKVEFDPIQGQAHNATVRDEQYTEVICDYVKHQRKANTAQRWFKAIFFFMVCAAFIAIIAVCLYAVFFIARKEKTNWSDFAVALTSFAGLMSTVIVLPGKIAEHLFPTGGDKDITEFIIKMIKADQEKLGDNWYDNLNDNPNDNSGEQQDETNKTEQ